MVECVHPVYGKAGATAVAEEFWALYFKQYVPSALLVQSILYLEATALLSFFFSCLKNILK